MKYRCFYLYFLLFLSYFLKSQSSIRGTVIDVDSKSPLIGVAVFLADSSGGIYAAETDDNGSYLISEVPVGRHLVKATYEGYEDLVVPNVLVQSGRQSLVDMQLTEKITVLETIVMESGTDKTKPLNDMSTNSVRMFSIEETNRYASSRNDPARMVANYAGVSGSNDSRNDIIIRGNSPLGVLWKLEGMDIPSPQHFGALGTTGGPISILNNNTLANSDFITGAFAAPYGNAISGVFDLNLRKGNFNKGEYITQVGFNGLELGAEGPLIKGKKASFLISGRYSTLKIFQMLGIDFGTGSAIPQYKDFTVKVDVPTSKKGNLSIWGIGGNSKVDLIKKDNPDGGLYDFDSTDNYYRTFMLALGMSHTYFFNSKSYGKISFVYSSAGNTARQDSLAPQVEPILYYAGLFKQSRLSLKYQYNYKLSTKNTINTAVVYQHLFSDYNDSVLTRYSGLSFYRKINNTVVNAPMIQYHVALQHRFSRKVTLNTGVYYQRFLMNGSQTLEPRAGLKYQVSDKDVVSLASGLHSQMQPLQTYFYETTDYATRESRKTNQNLGFSKAAHLVLGYDHNFSKYVRLKAEIYYQNLYNIPVEMRPSSFSMLNAGTFLGIPAVDSLMNNGKGKNIGMELTLERFYSKGYYFLITTSVFDSKYTGSDGVWRNTTFNGQYVFNTLFGKEFKVNEKNYLSLDFKFTAAGGRRYSGVDEQASMQSGTVVYDENEIFTNKYSDYFRFDVKLSYKNNMRRFSQEWFIDISNVTNHKNVFEVRYNPLKNTYTTSYQLGLFPVVQYRIYF